MRYILRTLFLLAALAVPANADEAPAVPQDPSPAAMSFVASFSDNHLTGMLKRIGARQPTMIALSNLHGQLLAAVYDAEVAESVKKYGPEWHRNMARSWTGLLTDDELSSLDTEGAASPHSEKYKSLRQQAGQRMQTVSQDLFRKILAETIQNTIRSLAEPAAEDGAGDKDKPAAKTD